MSAPVTSLAEFLAKRQAQQETLSPAPAAEPVKALVGVVCYADGSWRVTEQCHTAAEFASMFKAMAGACEALKHLWQDRVRPPCSS